MEKEQITPEKLGEALYHLNLMIAKDNFLNNKEMQENVGTKHFDRNALLGEIMAINMFSTIHALEGLKEEKLEKKIFDAMHDAYYNDLKDAGATSELILSQRLFIQKRYAEYQDATKEKRSPNRLWPLTHHALNNLIKEEVKEFFAMQYLLTYIGGIMKVILDFVAKYKISE